MHVATDSSCSQATKKLLFKPDLRPYILVITSATIISEIVSTMANSITLATNIVSEFSKQICVSLCACAD